MANKKQFGIKYPFTVESNKKTYIDMNSSQDEAIKSRVLHTIFTPKGQRLRNPDFGTNLIKFLFSPNSEVTLEEIKNEIITSITTYVPEVIFKDINIETTDDSHHINVMIKYNVKKGESIITTQVTVTL